MAKKPPGNKNKDAAANRREQLRQQQAKADKERKVRNIITFSVVGVAVLALIGTLIWVVVAATQQKSETATEGSGDLESYTLTIGEANAPVTVDIFLDYMCPYCGQFERANSADLETLVNDGTIKIKLHPMAFLDSNSNGTKFSTRAANALVTVSKGDPDKAMKFNTLMFENQPDEGTSGLSDNEIADIARQAGVSDDVVNSLKQQKYSDFVAKATQAAFDKGIESTPTIWVDGTKFSGNILTAGPLKEAIQEAAGK